MKVFLSGPESCEIKRVVSMQWIHGSETARDSCDPETRVTRQEDIHSGGSNGFLGSPPAVSGSPRSQQDPKFDPLRVFSTRPLGQVRQPSRIAYTLDGVVATRFRASGQLLKQRQILRQDPWMDHGVCRFAWNYSSSDASSSSSNTSRRRRPIDANMTGKPPWIGGCCKRRNTVHAEA